MDMEGIVGSAVYIIVFGGGSPWELQERVDFAERLLSQSQEQPQVAKGRMQS